ncbi:Crotonobetainyl-CoA:carnitine CoA-transferase CaiB [Sphingobium faniae]|nr:Crotonobetainyl-CoA:carnitine CoA-transferase CaiB [Sphingobium faniae]
MSDLSNFLLGVKILDLSQYIPGPMATLLLTDMGANVIKIEPPAGDEMRHLGPRDRAGQPVFYHALNAGKAIQRINLKEEQGRAAFLQMVEEADIVVEGFRPGVLKRLGVDYEVLEAVNPSIILCSLSGYGAGTRSVQAAGHDANYLALAGLLHRNGREEPVFLDPPVSDFAGALFAGMAILGALNWRNRERRGCHIDLALADVAMPMQLMQVADYGANRTVPARGSYYLNGGAAFYNIYATCDGEHVVVGAVEPKFWESFCRAAGKDEWIARRFEPEPQIALRGDLAAYFGSLTLEEAVATFDGIDCCFSPVKDLKAALEDPRISERQLVRYGDCGDLQALFPAWINGAPPPSRRSAWHREGSSAAPAISDEDESA